MTEIFEFFANHWQLTSILVLLIVAYCGFEIINATQEEKSVKVHDAIVLYNKKIASFVDIRDAKDFEAGHIVGSTHMNVENIDNLKRKLQRLTKKKVIFISENGSQASKLAKKISGDTKVELIFLQGGIHAWSAEGLPLTTSKERN